MNKKKVNDLAVLRLLTAATGLALCIGKTQAQMPAAEYAHFKNQAMKFEFDYPSRWKVAEALENCAVGCDNSEDSTKKLRFDDPSLGAEPGCGYPPSLQVRISKQSSYRRPEILDYATQKPLAGTEQVIELKGLKAKRINYATGGPEGGQERIERVEVREDGQVILFDFHFGLDGFLCGTPEEAGPSAKRQASEFQRTVDSVVSSIRLR